MGCSLAVGCLRMRLLAKIQFCLSFQFQSSLQQHFKKHRFSSGQGINSLSKLQVYQFNYRSTTALSTCLSQLQCHQAFSLNSFQLKIFKAVIQINTLFYLCCLKKVTASCSSLTLTMKAPSSQYSGVGSKLSTPQYLLVSACSPKNHSTSKSHLCMKLVLSFLRMGVK